MRPRKARRADPLLRSVLRRYVRQVTVVVILLVAQTIGNLCLPNLDADVINYGVEKGDVRYIWTTGGIMLAVALAIGAVAVVAVYWPSQMSIGAGADRARAGDRAAAVAARSAVTPVPRTAGTWRGSPGAWR